MTSRWKPLLHAGLVWNDSPSPRAQNLTLCSIWPTISLLLLLEALWTSIPIKEELQLEDTGDLGSIPNLHSCSEILNVRYPALDQVNSTIRRLLAMTSWMEVASSYPSTVFGPEIRM